MSEVEAWGQLVSLTDIESDPIPMSTDKFVIGRALGLLKKSPGGCSFSSLPNFVKGARRVVRKFIGTDPFFPLPANF